MVENIKFNDGKKYEENALKPVPAIYSHPLLPLDGHNPLICALPPKMKDEERREFYYRKLPFTPSICADGDVQLAEIDRLSTILLPLNITESLENRVYSILVNSYNKRENDLVIENKDVCVADERYNQTLSMDDSDGGDGHTGLAFTGIGGCGKTTLVKRLFERYPKTIIHDTPRGQFLQIVWLRVQPISNGDLKVFLNSIGKDIDKALMNNNNTYYNLISSKRTLAEKTEKLMELFKLFNVGILVIDEIQRFTVSKAKTDSFQTLMSIMNKTKAAIMVIGTGNAYHKLFYDYYFARRFGSPLPAAEYCSDYDYITGLIQIVMSTNWFKTPQKITTEIIQAMYKATSGIIERIITIWMDVQKKYVMLEDTAKDTFILTPQFIKNCSDEDETFMAEYASQILRNDSILSEDYEKCRQASEASLTTDSDDVSAEKSTIAPVQKEISEVFEEPNFFKVLSKTSDITKTQKLFARIKSNLKEGGEEYSHSFILDKLVHIMNLKSYANKTDDKIVAKALKTIRSKPEAKVNIKAMEIKDNDEIPKINFSKL